MYVKHFYCLLSCLVVLCISHSYVYAQTRKSDPVSIPAAQEWRFHKFGEIPVDYYTGTASVSIPIYTYKDNEFEIPLSLNYASNGYMPNIPTDVLGLGWYLNGIGDITRTIYGIEDDFWNHEQGSLYKWGTYQITTYPNKIEKINLESYLGIFSYFDPPYMLYPFPEHNECRPDVFYFKFPGHKGKFQFAPMAGYKYKVYDTDRPWGEYAIDVICGQAVQNTHYRTFDSFTIRAGDGYRYTFGGNSPALNVHSSPYSILNNVEYDTPCFAKINWPLTTILSPSGRIVKFNYEANTASEGAPRDDYYSTCQLIPDYTSRFFPSEFDKGYEYVNFHQIYGIEERMLSRYQSRIKTINIDNKMEISFKYIPKREELCRINGETPLHNRGLIGEIDIDRINADGSKTRIRTCKLNYSYTSGNPVALLNTVEISGEGVYRMQYYSETYQFPVHGKNLCDPWGFYNGTGSLNPSPGQAMIGMLKRITYPTQGSTLFEYEGHNFSKSIAKNIKDRARTFLVPTSIASSGGLRIRRITDYVSSDKVATCRDFLYTQNGESSGISLAYPRNIITQNTDYDTSVSQSQSVLDASHRAYTLDQTHIEYAMVTEIQMDNSKKVFYFSNYQDTPDENYISRESDYIKENRGDSDDRNPTSLQSQRGKLLRMESYDADGHLVYSETNLYDKSKFLETNPSLEYNSPNGLFINLYVKKSIIDNYPLICSRKVYYDGQDSIMLENRYAQNALGQVYMTETPDGNGNTIISKTQYVSEVPNPGKTLERINSRGMLAYPYKKQISIRKPDGTYLLAGERYNYFDFDLHYRDTPFPVESVSKTVLSGVTSLNQDFAFDSYLEPGIAYKYDWYGNIIQETDLNGVPTTYIWGHGGLFLVAKVVGVNYSEMESIPGLEWLDRFPVPENLTESQINSLYALGDVQVNIYDYDAFVGITRTIDPSGRRMYYTYDSDGRLQMIRDDKNIPTERYEYHLKTR